MSVPKYSLATLPRQRDVDLDKKKACWFTFSLFPSLLLQSCRSLTRLVGNSEGDLSPCLIECGCSTCTPQSAHLHTASTLTLSKPCGSHPRSGGPDACSPACQWTASCGIVAVPAREGGKWGREGRKLPIWHPARPSLFLQPFSPSRRPRPHPQTSY